MIKFFRKIRQKLLLENKFSGYLLYAIGEIILVVIGILIALYVNDLNEAKKFENQEKLFMHKMQEDIRLTGDYLNYTIQYLPRQIEEAQLALYAVQYCKIDSSTTPILEKTFITAGNLGTIFFRKATYEEMLSNSSFSRIKNDSLKNLIGELYDQLEHLNNSISYFRTELSEANKIIWRYVEKEFKSEITKNSLSDDQIDVPIENQVKVSFDFEELCKSSIFKNALIEIIDSRKDIYRSAKYVSEILNSTKQLMENEISTYDD